MTDHVTHRVATPTPSLGQLTLIGLFLTALITAQLTAAKVLLFEIPFTLPITGGALVVPGAALSYALTYFATDCYSELYGRDAATRMVNIGFVMNFVLLALVHVTIAAPAAPASVDPAAFGNILGASTNIILASLVAYVASQNWDVYVFHRLRALTEGRHLWFRNLGSTISSQLIDTVLFVTLGFFVIPNLLGTGTALPTAILVQLLVSQYLLKVLIATVDTPLIYSVIALVERDTDLSQLLSEVTRSERH